MMADHEPESGFNLPAGCTDADIERAFGLSGHRCGECPDWSECPCGCGWGVCTKSVELTNGEDECDV